MRLREHEAQARLFQAARQRRRVEAQLDAESGQNVGRPGLGGGGAVAVLGDEEEGGGDYGGGGAYVESVVGVASRADNVALPVPVLR